MWRRVDPEPDDRLEALLRSWEAESDEHPDPGHSEAALTTRADARLVSAARSSRWRAEPKAVVGVLMVVLAVVGGLGLKAWRAEATARPQPVLASRPSTLTGDVPRGASSSTSTGGASLPTGAQPTVSSPPQPTRAVVHVIGQVRKPGVVEVAADARVVDAVSAAGGVRPPADLSLINLARPVRDGEQILVPRPGQTPPPGLPSGAATDHPAPALPGAPGSGPGSGPQPSADSTPEVINLNTASAAELEGLPGVGPVLAQRIVDWRTEHGQFTDVEELGEVSGIGEKVLATLRPRVTL